MNKNKHITLTSKEALLALYRGLEKATPEQIFKIEKEFTFSIDLLEILDETPFSILFIPNSHSIIFQLVEENESTTIYYMFNNAEKVIVDYTEEKDSTFSHYILSEKQRKRIDCISDEDAWNTVKLLTTDFIKKDKYCFEEKYIIREQFPELLTVVFEQT